MNHCTHGTELNAYCPACILDVATFEEWTGRLDGELCNVPNIAALLQEAA